jgi:putative transposase
MRSLVQSFLLLIARSTDRELARYLEFLKAENRILRGRLPKHIIVTPRERQRLLRFGRPLGPAIKDLITIVTPRTFLRWLQAEREPRRPVRRPGRRPTPLDIRALIVRIARETGFGYTRILGELKKLGICSVSRSTVVKILKEEGLDPGPKRGEGTWDAFLKRHAETLWACDFFSTKFWTLRGAVDMFVFFAIHVGSRRAHVVGMSPNPDRVWMVQQARNLAIHFGEEAVAPKFLIRDLDTKFVREFDDVLASEGVEILRVGPKKPNLNPHAERFIQTTKQECLDHFLIFGEAHLRHLLKVFLDYYHELRPHQGLDNVPPSGARPPAPGACPAGQVECHEFLGGLLKSYHRKAA